MTKNLETLFEELANPAAPVASARLVQLSDLEPSEAGAFAERWLEVPTERRRDVVSRLIDLAEDNIELNFNTVFRKLLHDEDDEVRVKAILGLWECEERSLIEPLVRLLLQDPEEPVRSTAALALGRFAVLAETGRLLKRDFERLAAVLLGVIDDQDEAIEVRRRALEAIAPMTLPRVPDIIRAAFESGEPKARASALFAMGRTCNVEWLPTLLAELESDDPEMRYEAAIALGEIGDEDVAPRIAALLRDPDASVQAAAINALGQIGGPVAKAVLARTLHDDDPRLAELAEAALRSAEIGRNPLAMEDA